MNIIHKIIIYIVLVCINIHSIQGLSFCTSFLTPPGLCLSATENNESDCLYIISSNITAETVSHLFKTIRNHCGFTQMEFSKILGISQQSISGIEDNKKSISPLLLQKIVDFFLSHYSKDINERIVLLQELSGLSLKSFCDALGISKSELSNIKLGSMSVHVNVLHKAENIVRDQLNEDRMETLKVFQYYCGFTDKELSTFLDISQTDLSQMKDELTYIPLIILKKISRKIDERDSKISGILKALQIYLGLSEKIYGKALDLSQGNISMRTTGERSISPLLMKKTLNLVKNRQPQIAQNLAFFRKQLDLSQEELDNKLGLPDSSISKMEKGDLLIPLNVIYQVIELTPYRRSKNEAIDRNKFIKLLNSIQQDLGIDQRALAVKLDAHESYISHIKNDPSRSISLNFFNKATKLILEDKRLGKFLKDINASL